MIHPCCSIYQNVLLFVAEYYSTVGIYIPHVLKLLVLNDETNSLRLASISRIPHSFSINTKLIDK